MSSVDKAADAKRIEALASSVWSKLLAFAVQYLPAILEWLNRVLPKPATDDEHPHYVTSFPLSCITECVSILQGGTGSIQARMAEFCKHLWVIQSYLLGVVLGDPDAPFAMDAPPVSEQIAKLEELLKNLQAVHSEAVHGDHVSADAAAIDPTMIALLIQLILKFLERFKPKV